jgi:glycosyltransferase involved in cell wall biosynthesis
MRLLMLSKAAVVGIYQRKLEEIAKRGVDLLALVPPSWKDERGETRLERAYTDGYRLETIPIVRNGDFHLHFYRELGWWVNHFQPDILHIDEEPYNLSAWQALYHARRVGAKSVLFSWQNIARAYPPPFAWGERWALNHADALIAGTKSAAAVWREKGYRGEIAVIPQFGTDTDLFAPSSARLDRPFTIGYFGRLVEEKGVFVLLDAVAQIGGDWRLILLGGGPLREALRDKAARLGIADRVTFRPQVASTAMPAQYHDIDALVLPSLTRANWKEQFGRVLVEAMASGVPVVGSDSGAIPDVIGDAGLIVPEGDAPALANALRRLCDDAALSSDLRRRGRERAGSQFTHAIVAEKSVMVYRRLATSP